MSIFVVRWLLRRGRVVLIKLVLGRIMVYWMSIVRILNGILIKITKKRFKFSWIGKRANKGIIVKWCLLALIERMGGWGLKNIYLFIQSLTVKNLSILVYNEALRGRLIKSKNLGERSTVEWFR